MAMPAALGSAAVRLGNFFNSEIVGRPTDLPWAVRFPIHDCRSQSLCSAAVPRHPSQLYEFALGMLVLLGLFLIDRWAGKEKRPLGLLAGMFFVLYFTGRFLVEFVKEYQVDTLVVESSTLTMGQYLSIPMVLFGVLLVAWSLAKRRNAFTGHYE
jgi:prolipoprotein diacylglyceryl transferase